MEHNILKTYVFEEETDELDFVLDSDLGVDEDEEWKISDAPIPKGIHWNGSADPIKIERIRGLLDMAERDGATHVEIMHHEDHHSYVVTGLKFKRLNPKEVGKIEDALRQEEIGELEKRLAMMDKGRDLVISRLDDLKSQSA